MTFAAFLRNYRRILALVLASALLHVLALVLIARVPSAEPSAAALPPLVISLKAPEAPAPASAAEPVARTAPLPPSRIEDAAPPAVAPSAAGDAFAVPVDATSTHSPGTELPGPQNTRLPDSTTIHYEMKRRATGAADWANAGSAALSWQRARDSYRIEASSTPTGASAPTRTLTSEGIIGDAGILPQRARDAGTDGTRETVFDRDKDSISFSGSDRTAPVGPASQDRASMLLQLAALANADPGQLEGSVDLHVGGADSAAVVRFELVGVETIDTPMGELEALHLAQQADAGRARIEIWLARAHDYLPVRLVTRHPDGSEVLQSVVSITR